MLRGEPVGQRLGDDGDVARAGVQRLLYLDDAVVALVVDVRGKQRGAGLDRQLRRPGGHAGGFSEEIDLHPGPGEITVGHQAHELVLAQPFGEQFERRALTAGQRQHLEPQALPVLDESPVQRFRLQPFGDGGEGAVRMGQPHAGQVPISAVRQGQHATAPCLAAATSLSAPMNTSSRRRATAGRSIDGNRNASRQYRAYEASEARIRLSGTSSGGTPITLARFLRSCLGPPPSDA